MGGGLVPRRRCLESREDVVDLFDEFFVNLESYLGGVSEDEFLYIIELR